MHPALIAQLLALLAVANGTPIILSKVFWQGTNASRGWRRRIRGWKTAVWSLKDDARSRALHLGQLNWEVGVVELVKCDPAPI